MGALAKMLGWLARKATFTLALVIVGLGGFALWLFLRDSDAFELRRDALVRELTGKNQQLRSALAGIEARLAQLRADIPVEENRAREAARIAAEVEAQNSGFARLALSAEQVRENERRVQSLRQAEAAARARAAELQQVLTRTTWEKDGLEIALQGAAAELATAQAHQSKALHYTREAWARHGRTVAIAVALYFLGPPLLRLLAYFVFAPLISRRRPIRLGTEARDQPQVVTSRASVDVELEPGDALWVKEKYLQASDEGLVKATRWLLDWRMPFTCLAVGLKELVEMRNAAPESRMRATFSCQDEAHVELAVVTVPAGASLVLRPSYLAGLVGPLGRRAAAIRRHWRLFALQSWATGQFRYFEFVGPCRLLVAGSRGVRAEVLEPVPGQPPPARRSNQDATLGFTPGLAWRPVRAETFWAYFRGQNPLFDDRFEGRGVFLCQQTSAKGEAARQRGLMAGMRDGVLRVFGL
ncbi:MAG TPA: hypothetical protein VEB66_04645 [Opitutaceae bacterium]|nr:hypothetical protein [Opitutaceae bacterium]